MQDTFTIVIPAKNEEQSLPDLLENIRKLHDFEIIVVDDGSTDKTAQVALQYNCKVISHPYSLGNGAAIKSGARAAESEFIVFMDADGQHKPSDIKLLLQKIKLGHDMVVGARHKKSHASFLRMIANNIYNKLASWVTGHEILDLTSGFRIVKRTTFIRYLYMLPNGFSYPTTSTMAFFRAGHPIAYVNIEAKKRIGDSHINPFKDGIRFLIIIMKITSLYSPLKVFIPVSTMFMAFGLFNYLYTYLAYGRLTNMTVFMLMSSLIIFMFGLFSEQLTVLTYSASERRRDD